MLMKPARPRLTQKDFQVMPWKNRGGVTTELLREGIGETWDWRVSIAEIRSGGPFSVFPGVERHIMQLDGPMLTLTHGEHGATTLTAFEAHPFAGEWETACALG